jgi:ubiquinone biosynthesis protein Coq4
LGRAFADFLNLRGLDPYGLPRRPAVDEPTYLTAHLYETHDLWHVVTGFDTDVAGELGLQAFYLPQLHGKLPLLLLAAGLLNTLLFAFDDWRARLDAIVRGYRMGQRARPFFGVRWGEWWERTLSDVRQELRVEPETEEVSVAPSEPGLPPQRATAS